MEAKNNNLSVDYQKSSKMSTKFLHVFNDETSGLQKQIGCMTGFLQIFDRQHLLTRRRINGYNHKRNHPSGQAYALSTSGRLIADHGASSPKTVLEKTFSKSSNENQRISMESSRPSFSSSSCSSFSSLECGRSATQQEALSFEQAIFPDKSSKNSPSSADRRPPHYEPHKNLQNSSVQTARRSLDFRDVVKDSIKGDSRGLSIRTSPKEEVKTRVLKHRDSPRPMQLSKSMDRESSNLSESLQVLVKAKQAPRSFSDFGESPRSSFEAAKTASFYSETRGARRLSYDGRETRQQSLDYRENGKFLREPPALPRLSLDSKESSFRNLNLDLKLNSIMKDLDRSDGKQINSKASNLEQELVHRRSASVVAKLMGLEAMPSLSKSTSAPDDSISDLDLLDGQRSKPLKISHSSSKYSLKDPATVRVKQPDPIITGSNNSMIAIETAPWRHQEKLRFAQQAKLTQREAQLKQRPDSFYSEVEKKLKDLEVRRSRNDLRALKQMLGDMQEKGLLETKNADQTTIEHGAKNRKITPSAPTLKKGSKNGGTFESPIVVMKSANFVTRSGMTTTSVIPLEGQPGLRKLRIHDTMDKRNAATKNQLAKGETFNASVKDNRPHKSTSRLLQVPLRTQQSERENDGSSPKTSGSLSPRLQQKRLETEKSRFPIHSSDSSKPKRAPVNRKQLESVSPRNRLGQKPNGEVRNSSDEGEEISQRSENNISLASQVDIEVTSADRSVDKNSSLLQQGNHSPSGRAARKADSVIKQKKPSVNLNKEVSRMEFAATPSEQPSPNSVLDASFYQDDLPSSPLRKRLDHPKDEKLTSDDSWTPSDLRDSPAQNSSSEINQKKIQSIEDLLQKLRELSPSDDGISPKDHIASLCETQNPDHRYVSEILLASGLLFKDLSARPLGPMPIQLHASGHPINPDLFLVLEQTKASSFPKLGKSNKVDHEKLHRKLVFDMVNEILIQKLELKSLAPLSEYFVRSRKLAVRFPSGQQLLKELCLKIEQVQAETAKNENSEDESKVSHEVLRKSEAWVDFNKEAPGVALDIERLIFKDLIDEVVSCEIATASQSKSSRWGKQLLSK